jgi:putative heme-binding domain-containing protein
LIQATLAGFIRWVIVSVLVAFVQGAQQTSVQTAARVTEQALAPAAVWPAGPLDVVAAFERPVDPKRAQALVGQSIPYFVPAESIDGTGRQERRVGALRIMAVRASDGGRTLSIATDPHPLVARYIIPLAAREAGGNSEKARDAGAAYDLTGVEWGWSPAAADAGDDPQSQGWWPSLDLETTRRLTQGSRPHEASLTLQAQPGRLMLSALVRLPEGATTVRLQSTGTIEEATLGESQGEPIAAKGPDGLNTVELAVESKAKREPLFLTLRVQTGGDRRPFVLKASYRLAGDKTGTDHALERDQVLVPWAPLPAEAAVQAPLVLPDLSGGDPARGKTLFSGEQARCSQCHAFRGQGGKIGPDLTEIGKRGRAEIYRNIAAPSASIEPDYNSYTVATKDGQVVVGVVRAEGPTAIRVTDTNAKATVIERGQIAQIRPSGTSIMPVGLAAQLGDSAVRDIIAYLTTGSESRAGDVKK